MNPDAVTDLVCTDCWERVGEFGPMVDALYVEVVLNEEAERHISEAHPDRSPPMMMVLADESAHYIEPDA